MEASLIRNEKAKTSRGGYKASECTFIKFAANDASLIHTNRGQWRKTPCVAEIKEPIEMTTRTIHLMVSLSPFDATRRGQVAVSDADLSDRGGLQTFQ
jgi:hypothetical protein